MDFCQLYMDLGHCQKDSAAHYQILSMYTLELNDRTQILNTFPKLLDKISKVVV